MSPEKEKNQFAIFFQQYQTRDSAPSDPAESLLKATKHAKTTTQKKRSSSAEPKTKQITTKHQQTTATKQKQLTSPKPPLSKSTSSESPQQSTINTRDTLEPLDDDLTPNLLTDTNQLEVVQAVPTLLPHHDRENNRPGQPQLEKLSEEEATLNVGPRKRGRPANGKRSDSDWVARTFYIRKSTDNRVERVLKQMKRYNINFDKSELVDLLLEAWAMVESHEIDDFQIGEIIQADLKKSK